MLDLRRLRLLRELHERGTIAAVADALQYTPSAVSQQLAMLEREAGVPLLERAGRGVRLTDPALVLVEHATALLERAALAEADLAAASGTVSGRARIAGFQSVSLKLALPAIEALKRDAPRLRCELIEAEPEVALPALARGDLDLVLGDEWPHHPWRLPAGLQRHELMRDPIHVLLPVGHPAARHEAVPLRELAAEHWTTGHAGMTWDEMTRRTCLQHGGFEPDIRHRTNDATISLALVARGLAVTLLPDLVLPASHPEIAVRAIAETPMSRTIWAVTRTADGARPSTQALLAAVREAAPMIRTAHTADLDPATLATARALFDDVFEGEFSDHDWEHGLGGIHALAYDDGELIGHGSVVQRRLLYGGRALRTGYVEGIAVRADRRRRGHAAALMEALERVVRGAYELGALAATDVGALLYESRGWRRWEGPLHCLSPGGVVPTEGESIYVLPVSVELELTGSLTCDWRDGDVW